MKKVILFFIILSIVLGLSRFNNKTVEEKIVPTVAPTMFVANNELTGWFASFDIEKAETALPPIIDRFSIFSPMLYRVMADGSLGEHQIYNRETIISYAQERNIPVAPVFTDESDSVRISKLLYNQATQKKFLADLVQVAQEENFSGWSIDIEKVKSTDEKAFSQFIINTSEALHKNNLKLYVIAYGRDSDETYDPALAHDYKIFGQYADQVQLMIYYYSNEYTDPGGQTPLKDYRSVLKYALENIPREKILIGLSTHGNDWGGDEVEGMTYSEVLERIQEENATISYDKNESSMVAKYKRDGEDHILMYENADTIIEKMEIARKEFGINKFAFWRLSAEDPELWEKL